MSFIFKIEAMSATSSSKWRRAINEKYRVIYVVFFAKPREN